MSTAVDAVHVTWVNLRLGLRNHECRFKIQNSTAALPPTVIHTHNLKRIGLISGTGYLIQKWVFHGFGQKHSHHLMIHLCLGNF